MENPVSTLSNQDRIAHYRRLAIEAMHHAHESSGDDHRYAFLAIASAWAALADEVERQQRREVAIAAMNAA